MSDTQEEVVTEVPADETPVSAPADEPTPSEEVAPEATPEHAA